MNSRCFFGARAGMLAASMLLMVSGLIAGCGGGGGSDKDIATFNNPSGTVSDLSNITVQPYRYQSGLMSRGATFVLSAPTLASAPRSLSASLWRYKEARGGEDMAIYRENISASQPNPSLPQWTIRRSSSDLDAGGTYYLEVGSPAQTRTYAFVVARDRSVTLPDTPVTREATINNPGGTGTIDNLILHWTNEQSGSVDIPLQTTFTLQFPSDAQAPSKFYARIGRWKEGRGSEGFSYNEQNAEIQHTGNGTWTVRRSDGFDLERGGTYILEVRTDATPEPDRYAFLVTR